VVLLFTLETAPADTEATRERFHLRAMEDDMIRTSAAALFLASSINMANAIDLNELRPCRAAAVRLCDRSQGITAEALWRCGATLASRHTEVGRRCVAVLVRYGQL
jgi:hypothetical protein